MASCVRWGLGVDDLAARRVGEQAEQQEGRGSASLSPPFSLLLSHLFFFLFFCLLGERIYKRLEILFSIAKEEELVRETDGDDD